MLCPSGRVYREDRRVNTDCFKLLLNPIVDTKAGPLGLLLLRKREAELVASRNAAVLSK